MKYLLKHAFVFCLLILFCLILIGCSGESNKTPIRDIATLEKYREMIIGTWKGKVSTPWTEPYDVQISFLANGKYSAHSLTQTAFIGSNQKFWVPAFYYGTDDDSNLKIYTISSVIANGNATGEIVIYFEIGTTTTDWLESIEFYNGFTILNLKFWHLSIYGPINFNLNRQ